MAPRIGGAYEQEPITKRVFHINDPARNSKYKFASNGIKTSRYNLISFVPVNLFEQFRRLANFYFLCTVLLDCIPNVSPFPVYTLALPLAFIILVSMVKAGYEDYLRHVEDRRLNSKIHSRLDSSGRIEIVRSHKIAVGDILRISKGEVFPADVILLGSSNPDNNCYVNTAELDGETAPKAKRSSRISLPDISPESLSKLKGEFCGSLPFPKFDGFEGRLDLICTDISGEEKALTSGLADDQICLRGSKLENAQYIYALVYATGRDTKIMLNRLNSNFKFSSFEKSLNKGVLFSFCFELVINFAFAIANSFQTTYTNLERSFWANVGYEFVTSFILFSYFIPLSLYVTMELTKFGQGILIANDKRLSVIEWEIKKIDDEEIQLSDEIDNSNVGLHERFAFGSGLEMEPITFNVAPSLYPSIADKRVPVRKLARVRSTDINDELGMVEFVMSDKTGTLTKNQMVLKACFIDGVQFINSNSFPDLLINEKQKSNRVYVDSLKSISAILSDKHHLKFSDFTLSRSLDNSIIKLFIFNMLCCNEIIVSSNSSDPSKGKYIYLSLSPDEIAFLEALEANGITLLQSSDSVKKASIQREDGSCTDITFSIHGILAFSADRKRMSVVVENDNNEYFLFTKGADSKVSSLLQKSQFNDLAFTSTNEYLEKFASDGNRTLTFASRSLSKKQFEEWHRAFTEASISLENRERRLEDSFALIEQEMSLLGCTSVEDPLQDGVPQAVSDLIRANITVVVLTGDKQETAVAIGKSANIITSDLKLHFIISEEHKDLDRELESLLSELLLETEEKHALVINGSALETSIREISDTFLQILSRMQTVICSRATPSQKAEMVNLVRKSMNKICLAIGDGANDVSMIQKADVGIGLTGKEGTQAAQNADYVLHQFRHLPRLLFTHGRYSYQRICKVVYWSFYKNTLFPFPLVLYGIFSSWSDMPMYDSYIMNLFNVIYTAFPPLVIGWTEKDITEQCALSNPEMYAEFRTSEQFTVFKFIRYICIGLVQASICFWIAFGIFYDIEVISSDGTTAGIYVFGQWIATSTILVINLSFLMMAHNWTGMLLGSAGIGILSYILTYVVFGYWISVDADLYGVAKYIFEPVTQYLYVLIALVLSLIVLRVTVINPNKGK